MSLAPAELKCQVIHQHVGSSPPYQPALVMRLSELCHALKLGGAALEEAGRGLDTLQARAVAGLPAVRPRPQAPAADTRAGIRKKIQRKQTETLLIFLRKTYFKESQVRG